MKSLYALAMITYTLSATAGPAEFARGRVILVGEELVQRATIPPDVYEWVVNDDLGDLRVYNRNAEEVPYALRRPATTSAHTGWQQLPLFTLPDSAMRGGAGTEVDIELGADGTVVAVHAAVPGTRGEPTDRQDYLIDLSQYDNDVFELELDWVETSANFISHFRLEASEDLNAWRSAVNSATLAALQTGGKQVLLKRIALNGIRSKYLLLHQLDGADTLTITRVQARRQESQAPNRHWNSLPGTATDEGYEFDTGGRFPVDRIVVELARASYLVETQLYSRGESTDEWRDRGQRTFYRVSVNGDNVATEPIAYASSFHRFWRVVPLGDDAVVPSLKVGWLPDELVFLKQGDPPFTLAYGQADVTGRQWPIDDLLRRLETTDDLDELPIASLSEPQVLGGADRLIGEPAPVDWRTMMLWLILLIGVGVIGALAWRLARQVDD